MKRTIEDVIAVAISILGLAAMIYFSGTGSTYMAVLGLLVMIGGVVVVAVNHGRWIRAMFYPGPQTDNLKIRGTARERAFIRVQNTINNKKVFVSVEEDGIYIRLAGDENNGEAFNENKVKVYDYNV